MGRAYTEHSDKQDTIHVGRKLKLGKVTRTKKHSKNKMKVFLQSNWIHKNIVLLRFRLITQSSSECLTENNSIFCRI